ncbi:MAG TPA: hypothetical protein VK145_00520, partial [Candidatus Nanoarchaeia archaeon]|nr:hypothetical protein [Candidatus Nanoarchaeia archaeon]
MTGIDNLILKLRLLFDPGAQHSMLILPAEFASRAKTTSIKPLRIRGVSGAMPILITERVTVTLQGLNDVMNDGSTLTITPLFCRTEVSWKTSRPDFTPNWLKEYETRLADQELLMNDKTHLEFALILGIDDVYNCRRRFLFRRDGLVFHETPFGLILGGKFREEDEALTCSLMAPL